jgi:hypothetical protein
MPADPHQHQAASGVVHIDNETGSRGLPGPSVFLVSFGGKKDGVGAF